ncbi:MAG: phosphoglycerate dehydrogenase [Actinomycetota bacterium]|nr:phosphoglycerate dehydrogenase [Actinomycetota bacterium]
MQILISTSTFNLDNFSELAEIQKAGIEVKLNPFKTRLTEDQVTELLGTNTIGLIAGLETLNEKVLAAATALKVIARVGTGLDSVDLEAAAKLDITVLNTPDAPTSAVAELTLGHILSLLRNIASTDRQIRNNTWRGQMGSLLETKSVGIVGFGRIGQRVADLVSAFGAKVIVSDPYLQTQDYENCALDKLCQKVDILTLHIPYTESTHNLISAKRIESMKRGSFIINISRGGLVDEDALLQALQSGHIAGAALDCFEQEPYFGPLSKLENVQMTAHMGTYARETRDRMEQEASLLLVKVLRQKEIIK